MKFLCDQCKAKYQISDDKVAGKTVRMKCRKCGHLIEVRAAVTESSVATSLPPGAMAGTSSRPPAPKPSTLPKSPLATSLAQAKPAAPRPPGKPEAGGPSGLSTAFKSSMQAREDEAALLELSSADEWYAAINGVPVGPIRIGELRRKASLGAVNDDSLVWQEGMEEWRPVKTIPELAALVREAATSGRVSLVTPDPPNARSSVAPPAPARPAPPQRPTPPRPTTEPPRPAATARNNVVPITSRLATAERLDEGPAAEPTSDRHLLAEDPFAHAPEGGISGAPAAVAAPAAAFTPPPPAQGSSPSIGLTPAPAPAAAAPPPSQQAPVIVQMPAQRQPTNFIGIALIAGMMVFAGVGAWAVFFNKPPPAPVAAPPTIVTQYLPAPVAPAASTAAPADSAPTKRAVAAAPRQTTGAAPLKLAPGLDLGALAPGGPAPAGGATGGGTGLEGGQVEAVVHMHNSAVKRVCWERIGGGGATSAIENVRISIDGSGHVSSASAEGNNTTVGSCLEKEIRSWTFPPSGGTTEVNLPFKFLSQ